MSFTPTTQQLQGLPYNIAECYGKPHIGCYYESDNVKSHKRMENAICCCCGTLATNAHHNPPLSRGRSFNLYTPTGIHALKPALFALCGSGTTGCHNGFHGGARYKAEWIWLSDEYAEMWWNGELLKKYAPHSKELYGFGYWRITDKKRGKSFEVSV